RKLIEENQFVVSLLHKSSTSCLNLSLTVWMVSTTLSLSSFSSFFFSVDVLLKAVGDTPIMKTKKWAVDRGRTVQSLGQFISRFLKLEATEQLFIYVNQSFAPSPDQDVGILFDCFGSDGKLVLHYCKSQAWG
uniref:Ubiquitin-like protein ATG12 n=1 Tax=Labrus bergylta TaxID=56723 RepID=A0A3Q3FJZ4_9LABR